MLTNTAQIDSFNHLNQNYTIPPYGKLRKNVFIALALKDTFKVHSINDLPLVFNIAWYEQKAVIVLLALLYLDVQNIHTGPTLPAFFTPDILKVLQEKFHIGTISTVENDIATLIG